MRFVSLPIEILRTRPRTIFWLAVTAQALIWLLVPTLFYAAPPGDLPELLVRARHFDSLALHTPPLAYWLADIAFLFGGMFGVYALSQACIVFTLWAVFSLGCATLGERHAALATLLMTGVYFLTVPTPAFSPAILAAPFWALALLQLWRVTTEDRDSAWRALAASLVLLLLTTYLASLLIALVALFIAQNPKLRASLNRRGPATAVTILGVMLIPHLFWLVAGDGIGLAHPSDLRATGLTGANLAAFARIAGLLLLGHAGLAIMVAVAVARPHRRQAQSVSVAREATNDAAAFFIWFFALTPGLTLAIAAVLAGYAGPMDFAPVVILSGLACMLAAGPVVTLHQQRASILVWFVFLLAPPLLAIMTTFLLLPWSAARDLRVTWPAPEMGRFFTENFERRAGHKLSLVTGEPALAAIVAAGAASRPLMLPFNESAPPPFSASDTVREKGALVVWRARDDKGLPPPDIVARFPGLIPEVPQTFMRRVEGRLPPLRLGWAVIRPQPHPTPQTTTPDAKPR